MSKKFNASTNQNTEDLAAKTFADPESFVANEVPNDADVPSWDSEEHIWNAARARKISDTYGSRILKKGLRDVMRYIKTAADSGQYECTIYNDHIASDANIDDVIRNLVARGYTVKKFEQYSGWYIKISW